MTGSFLPDGVFGAEVIFESRGADRFGRVDPSDLLWQMQEIAGAHYEALGLGWEFIRSHGCFWAVTRSELEVLAPLPEDRTLRLETWSGRFGHGLYRRHYRLRAPEGGVLARGVSVWVLMDIQTRLMAADRTWLPDPHVLSFPDELSGQRRFPFPALTERAARTVLPEETDRNGHLNNTVYLRWAADLLPESFAAGHWLRTLWIEYKKELPLGQTAELSYALTDRTLFLLGTAEGRDSFRMRCEYDPI